MDAYHYRFAGKGRKQRREEMKKIKKMICYTTGLPFNVTYRKKFIIAVPFTKSLKSSTLNVLSFTEKCKNSIK